MSKIKNNHISFFDSLLDKETLSEEDFIKLNKIWEQFLQWRKNKESKEKLKYFLEYIKPRQNEEDEEDEDYDFLEDNY